MKLQFNLFSFTLFFFLASAASAENLNEAYIQEFIAEIDRTVMQKNITKLAEFLSDDISITTYVSILGNLRTETANKEKYLSMLEDVWKKTKDYHYSRQNLEIELLEDGKSARVSSTIRESMIFEGVPITSVATEANIIELINGKAQITKMTGETTI